MCRGDFKCISLRFVGKKIFDTNMKTVLIGIPCLLIGGTEVQTLRLTEALVEEGYHVVTVCYFEYHTQMVEKYKSAGSEVVCLSAYGERPSKKKQFKFLYTGLKRVIKDYKPDVAHIQYMAPGALPILACKLLGIKTIIATAHTSADIYKNLFVVRMIAKVFTKVFSCVSLSSEQSFFGSSQLLTEQTHIGHHCHLTIYNGIRLDALKLERKRVLPEVPTIGVVARLETIKGADLIIPTFSKILAHGVNCKLMIVGDGSLKNMMQQQQNELNINSDKIQWIGRVEASKLPKLYQQMDIVWCPSRSEGFGLTAVEAMASGAVVIASDIGGLSEIVSDCGLLFPRESTEVLCDKTLALFADSIQYATLSEKSLKQSKKYDYNQYRKQIALLYAKILS